jgi:endonuclease YncB( thermonuclease family)
MRRKPVLALPILLVLALLAWPVSAEEFTGRVVAITDGDTIKVLRNGHAEIVRLRGIDAPEKTQAYGERAKRYLSGLVFGRTVTVQAVQRDRHGRTLAGVLLPDGRDVNQELVRAGYAWWFPRYSPDYRLARLEAEARESRRGLWADRHPLPPWEHRRQHRGATSRATGNRGAPFLGVPCSYGARADRDLPDGRRRRQ